MAAIRMEVEKGIHHMEARRKATFLALREKVDVIFEFNGVDHTITLEEAKSLLPQCLKDSLSEFDSIKIDFDRRLKNTKGRIQEDMELLQSLLPDSVTSSA